MRATANTYKKPCTIEIVVSNKTTEPMIIYIMAQDPDKPHTQYTNRYGVIQGTQSFYIRMPQSPEITEIRVASEKELRTKKKDPDYQVVSLKKLDLKTKPEAYASANSKVKSFLQFAQEFSEVAGYISANNSIYTSDDSLFQINYVDEIQGRRGEVLATPARIGRIHGIIEASKQKFKHYTVPMRMCILLHEFSHFNLNENMADEIEADLNALAIYLGAGYPRIDALNVFTQVFAKSDTEQNRERIAIIEQFIADFDREHRDQTLNPNKSQFSGALPLIAGSILTKEDV